MYNESLDDLIKDSKSKSLKKELYKVKEILNNSISSNTEAHESFSKKGLWMIFLLSKKISNFMHKNKSKLLTNTDQLIIIFDQLIASIRKRDL